jgi:hypothetical protein
MDWVDASIVMTAYELMVMDMKITYLIWILGIKT